MLLWLIAVVMAWTVAAVSLGRPIPLGKNHRPAQTAVEALSTWDGEWYLRIVTIGYSAETSERKSLNFFPLYPKVAGALGGKSHAALAGIILSQVLTLGSLVLMSLLAHGQRRAPLFQEPGFWLLINPFAFFLLAFYTESLFLFVTLVHFAAYARNRASVSIVAGFLAGLTRPTAIALPALLGTEAVQRWRKGEPVKWVAFAAIAPLAGVAAYVFGYIPWKTGDIAGYADMSQRFWPQSLTVPFYPLIVDIRTWVGAMIDGRIPSPDMILRTASTVAVVVVLVWQRRKLPLSWLAYCAAALLLMHSLTPWRGSGRYEAVLFPVFFAFACSKLASSRWAWVIAALMVTTWIFALYQFATWRWIA